MITNSPGKENRTPVRQTRSGKKRVAALLDEDSVDYVPIQKVDSAKKAKLTDHQKETFLAPRDKLPYMEEESIQVKSDLLQTRAGAQYDVESNETTVSLMTGSQPAKGPSNFEALHAEQQKANTPLVNDSGGEKKRGRGRSRKTSIEKAVDVESRPVEDRKEVVNPPKTEKVVEEETNSGEKKRGRGRPRKSSVEKAVEIPKTTSAKKEESAKTTRTRRSQIEAKDDNTKEGKPSKKQENSQEKSAKKAETSAEPAKNPEPEKKPTAEEEVALGTRSRRSLLKGTPTKYVAKPRTSRTPNGRVQKRETEKAKEEGDSDDDHIPLGVLVKRGAKEPEVGKEVLEKKKETTEEAAGKAPEVEKSIELAVPPVIKEKMASELFGTEKMEENDVIELSPGPEKKENAENSVDTVQEPVLEEKASSDLPSPLENLLTPPRNTEIQLIVNPATHSTPGILKTVSTPTTQGRKHVHFDQEVALKEDEKSTPMRKRIDSFFKKSEPSTAPLFPGLIGNETPISKIVPRLTSVSTHGAFKILQGQLTNNKIFTVGDLAGASEALVNKVSIKIETAKRALEEFSKRAEILILSSPPLPVKISEAPEVMAGVCPAIVLPEENEEIGELKNIEGLSPKPSGEIIIEDDEEKPEIMEVEEQVPIVAVEVEQLPEESAMEAELAEPVKELVQMAEEPVIEAAHTPLKDEVQLMVDVLREVIEIRTRQEFIGRVPEAKEEKTEKPKPVENIVKELETGEKPAETKETVPEEKSTFSAIEIEVSEAVEESGPVDEPLAEVEPVLESEKEVAKAQEDAKMELEFEPVVETEPAQEIEKPVSLEEAPMEVEQPVEEDPKPTEDAKEPLGKELAPNPEEKPENDLSIAEEESKATKKLCNFKLFQTGIWALQQFIATHGNDLTAEESTEMVEDVENLLLEAKKCQK